MSIVKVLFVAVTACFFTALLSQYKPEFSLIIRLAAVVFIVLIAFEPIAEMTADLLDITDGTKINNEYIFLLIKVVITAVICHTVSEVCADTGNRAVAFCVDLVGRVSIVLLSVPLLKAIIQITRELINE